MSLAYARSGRSLWSLWSLLTIAAAGFALIAAGIYLDSNRWIGLGTGVFTLAGMGFLFVQFWNIGTGARLGFLQRVPAATQVAVTPPLSETATTGPDGRLEDLVEFQLVSEKEAPTQLEVPTAFNLEATVNAAPPEPDPSAVFPWLAKDVQETTPQMVHATERRRDIVQGLPLLSSIFGTEPATTKEVAPQRAGRSRGQCGGCGTMLWAPAQRPLRLRCPKCGHVRTLTE